MSFINMIGIVDTHAAGCPIRILTGSGFPVLHGNTMLEKMLDMQKNYDWVRSMTMCEPRGHRQMVGAVLTQPVNPMADIGVFYIDAGGYAPMCGAGSIALGRALVETGIVPLKEPVTAVRMDTPSGLVTSYAQVKNGRIETVYFENPDSFVYARGKQVEVPGEGEILCDILYGGNFFLSTSSETLGIELTPQNADRLTELGMRILRAANTQLKVVHPNEPGITFLNDIQFTQKPYQEGEKMIYRNTVVFGGSQIDRSPCGTGTCARMAALYEDGLLKIGELFIHESILGTRFTGHITGAEPRDGFTRVTCRVEGDTHITAIGSLTADHDDPLRNGFLIG